MVFRKERSTTRGYSYRYKYGIGASNECNTGLAILDLIMFRLFLSGPGLLFPFSPLICYKRRSACLALSCNWLVLSNMSLNVPRIVESLRRMLWWFLTCRDDLLTVLTIETLHDKQYKTLHGADRTRQDKPRREKTIQ